jgi:hypothetical protein
MRLGSIRVPACGVWRLAEHGFPAGRRKLRARRVRSPGRIATPAHAQPIPLEVPERRPVRNRPSAVSRHQVKFSGHSPTPLPGRQAFSPWPFLEDPFGICYSDPLPGSVMKSSRLQLVWMARGRSKPSLPYTSRRSVRARRDGEILSHMRQNLVAVRSCDSHAEILSFPFFDLGPMKGELNDCAGGQACRRQVGKEQVR